MHKKGVALLITLFFIMLITMSIGIGLKYINNSTKSIKENQSLVQDSILVGDILKILKTLPQLKDINSTEDFAQFLTESKTIPLQTKAIDIILHLSSARAKINPIVFKDKKALESFKIFLQNKMVNTEYADMFYDLINGYKQDGIYTTDIFNDYPELYREGISSYAQLDMLADIYKQKYHENSIDKLDMKDIFYMTHDTKNYEIDANYLSSLGWQLILGCSEERANELLSDGYLYATKKDLKDALSKEERDLASHFKINVNKEIITIQMQINSNKQESNIKFEYNIKTNTGSNFVFKI